MLRKELALPLWLSLILPAISASALDCGCDRNEYQTEGNSLLSLNTIDGNIISGSTSYPDGVSIDVVFENQNPFNINVIVLSPFRGSMS